MDSLYLLIPLSVILVFVALIVLWRAIDSDQFDNLEQESKRILIDETDA